MKIDFHVHTAPLSKAALQTPEQALQAARECGLEGLVFTETNIVRNSAAFVALHELARVRYDLTVYQGLYLHTTLGPLLVYGQSVAQSGLTGIRIESRPDTIAAVDYCLEQGWAMVLAHPFRHGVGAEEGICHRFKRSSDPVAEAMAEVGFIARKMHAIEIDGCATKEDNNLAEGLAARLNLPLVVGSGAYYHTQIRPGAWTRLPGAARVNERLASTLIEAARKGKTNDSLRLPDLKGIYSTGRGSREP